MTQTHTARPEQEARRRRTVLWVVSLATVGLIFDGYDLVVYGTVVSTFLRDPSQIGEVTPALAGALGSYALVGVLVGALLAGSVGDVIGRRKVMLFAYAWFSVGMGVTAHDEQRQRVRADALRHRSRRRRAGRDDRGDRLRVRAARARRTCATRSPTAGCRMGSLLAALLAIMLLGAIGWRGMFWIGALPLVTLLPLAILKMPESPAWLLARGRVEEARALSEQTGVPLADAPPAGRRAPGPVKRERTGFAGLFGRRVLAGRPCCWA